MEVAPVVIPRDEQTVTMGAYTNVTTEVRTAFHGWVNETSWWMKSAHSR